MKKIVLGLLLMSGVALYAVDNVSRFKGQTLAQGGTSNSNNSTLIESSSPTNAFKIVVVTASVAGAATSATNTFATAFVATPTIVAGHKSGTAFNSAGYGVVVPTVTTSGLIVTGMNSAGATNDLPFIVYGYTRTGKLE